MSLISCPECRREISDKAPTCPGCGIPIATTSETNNFGFDIEKSVDRYSFSKIAFVAGKGTISIPQSYVFIDKKVGLGTFYYRLKQIDTDGSFQYSEILKVETNAPESFALYQNHPNPFNPETIIRYQFPQESEVGHRGGAADGGEVAEMPVPEGLAQRSARYPGANESGDVLTLLLGDRRDTRKRATSLAHGACGIADGEDVADPGNREIGIDLDPALVVPKCQCCGANGVQRGSRQCSGNEIVGSHCGNVRIGGLMSVRKLGFIK